MASYRYRALIPSQELGEGTSINGGEAEIAVFSKPCVEDLELAKDLKSQGCKIVVDYCDNHFNHRDLGLIYRELLNLSDKVVCSTEAMEKIIKNLGFDSTVIPDPYEMDEVSPHADGLQYLWYGHEINLKDIGNLAKIKKLTVVTGPNEIEGTVQWSSENIKREMSLANCVLFPTSLGSEYKSANRLINSLRQGLFPICSWHPAYEEFKDFCWVGDIYTGLRWARFYQKDLNDLVLQGQECIREKYSPKAIGEQWKTVLESI